MNFRKIILLGLITSIGTTTQAELIINTSPTYQTNDSTAVDSNVITSPQMPSVESAEKLMQVLRVDEQIETLVQAGQIANVASGEFKLPEVNEEELTPEQRQIRRRIEQILSQTGDVLGDGITSSFDQDQLEQAYMDAVQMHYTQDEVDALIAFYDTPVGQRILEKEAKVTQDFLRAGMSHMKAGAKQDIEQSISQILSILTRQREGE